jgi:hypothetical protein
MQLGLFKFKVSSLLVWASGVVTAYFMGLALHDLWGCLRLEERTSADVYKWKTVEVASSQFGIKAAYTYKVHGKTYRGKTFFAKPYHLNENSVQKQVEQFSRQSWVVWYQPSHPKISSLEKIFPTKRVIYALMTLGVFFYFLYVDHQRVVFSKSL